MKRILQSLIALMLVAVPWQSSKAAEKPDCPDNSCFDTKLISEQQKGDCTTYTIEISQDGSCAYALSHFSLAVECGRITDVSNSDGWAMEVGTTDPATGITGIKIDDIKNFGESDSPQSFTVTYTVCGAACESTVPERVAYKASTCVHYDEVTLPYVPMQANLLVKNISCAGGSDGAADLTIEGGLAPYTFLWSNGATTEDIAGVMAGAYEVNVTDATGASVKLNASIIAPLALEAAAEIAAAVCGENDTISLAVTGGTAPYTYLWSNGASASSVNAEAGTYTVLVKDANGCSLSQSYTIGEAGGVQVSVSGGDHCGDNNLSALVTGGVAPYTYTWSTGESAAEISASGSGLYSVTVTDASGCTATATKEVVAGNAPELQIEAVDPTCAYGTDGSIDLTVAGGSGSFTYSWSSGQQTEDLQNLRAGTYTVTVSDESGCSVSASVVLSNPQSIFVRSTEIIQPDCNGGLGSVSVEALFGTEPYIFEWSNGETGSSLSGLEPDVYRVTITDANGCSSSRSFAITAPSSPSVSISGENCSSTLTAVSSGGTAPYTYEWSNGETTSSIEITAGGTYEVVVTDVNGCTSTATTTAGDPAAVISLSYEVVQPTCYGGNNGSIDLLLESADGSYTIKWSNGATTEDLTGLSAGTYTVTISNESGCSVTETISISSPQAIYIRPLEVKNVSCLGEGGSISVEANFGTAPYTYEWDNGMSGSAVYGLEMGYYTVVVTDANGCSGSRRYYISEDSAPVVAIESAGCGGSYQLTASVAGGKAPFTYNWSSGETTEIISAGNGTYSLTVTDVNGCSSTADIILDGAEAPIQLSVNVKDVNCAGGKDGAASLQVNGGVAPYTFDWSNGLTGAEVTGLSAGVYSVKVTDASGCSEVMAFTIKEPQAMSITAVAEHTTGCGAPSGSISVQVSGGTAPYTYMWNTGAETQQLEALPAGSYTLTVEDAKGCMAIRSFTIEEGEGDNSSLTASLEACADTVICRGSIAQLPVYFSGQAPYTFTYSDGAREYSVQTTENPFVLEVSPLVKTTYTLSGISNACGEGTVSGQTSIQVSDCSKAQVCEDPCFDTKVVSRVQNGSCETITLQVSTDGDCRYALSHFNVAVGCGTVSSASNSNGWPMEINALDPTTGLYGIKVDEIRNFGEKSGSQSFTITYTLCNDNSSCQEAGASCGPLVAYKAGSCVYYDKATEGQLLAEQTASSGTSDLLPAFELYPNPYLQGQVLTVAIKDLVKEGNVTLTISNLTNVKLYKATHKVSPSQSTISLAFDNLASGVYIVALEVEGRMIAKQLYVL